MGEVPTITCWVVHLFVSVHAESLGSAGLPAIQRHQALATSKRAGRCVASISQHYQVIGRADEIRTVVQCDLDNLLIATGQSRRMEPAWDNMTIIVNRIHPGLSIALCQLLDGNTLT